jgi:chaperonin GroES
MTLAKDTHPTQDRILVRRKQAADKTPGGILIPDIAKEKLIEGEVVAVGPGMVLEDGSSRTLDVKVGDKIFFGKWSGTEIGFEEAGDHLIIREGDVIGVFGDPNERSSIRFMPLGARVVLLPEEPPEKIGHIIIPDNARENMRSMKGTAVAVGLGMRTKDGKRWPIDVKVGDTVYYGPKFEGTSIEVDGQKLLVVRDDYVHAVEEKASAS